MPLKKCPGRDMRNWTPDDVREVACPDCGEVAEFFKTDLKLPCPGCGRALHNPRHAPDCANWCASARECLGLDGDE
jgi:hypothetical protein